MTVEIKKKAWIEPAPAWSGPGQWSKRHTRVTLYIVLKDGTRVDSFQRYRNAQRCARRLKLAPSSR